MYVKPSQGIIGSELAGKLASDVTEYVRVSIAVFKLLSDFQEAWSLYGSSTRTNTDYTKKYLGTQ